MSFSLEEKCWTNFPTQPHLRKRGWRLNLRIIVVNEERDSSCSLFVCARSDTRQKEFFSLCNHWSVKMEFSNEIVGKWEWKCLLSFPSSLQEIFESWENVQQATSFSLLITFIDKTSHVFPKLLFNFFFTTNHANSQPDDNDSNFYSFNTM